MTAVTPGAAAVETMTAIAQDEYGTAPEAALRLAEITRPAIADDEILMRVRAASADRGTWHLMAGLPYPMRQCRTEDRDRDQSRASNRRNTKHGALSQFRPDPTKLRLRLDNVLARGAGWATQRGRGAPCGTTGISLIRSRRLRCLLRE